MRFLIFWNMSVIALSHVIFLYVGHPIWKISNLRFFLYLATLKSLWYQITVRNNFAKCSIFSTLWTIKYFEHCRQHSVCGRCPVCSVLGDYPNQVALHWVRWVTIGLRPARQNAEREVIFLETVDWVQTLLNRRLYQHKFSAVSQCPHENAIHAGTSGGKKAKERGKGKKGVRICTSTK